MIPNKTPSSDPKLLTDKCLLNSAKGDEAIVLFLHDGDFTIYLTKYRMFPINAQIGTWFQVKYFVTTSKRNVTIREAFSTCDVVPTRKKSNCAEILLLVTAVKSHFVCSYGSINPIEDQQIKRRIQASLNGEYAWCTVDGPNHAFTVVELRMPKCTQPTTSGVSAANARLKSNGTAPTAVPDGDAAEYGVIGRVAANEVTFVMLYPGTNFYCFKMKTTDFPDVLNEDSLGRWYKLWLVTSENFTTKQYVRSEEIDQMRPTTVQKGNLRVLAKITVHPVTGFLVCEFGKLVMPNQDLCKIIKEQRDGKYWCSFDMTSNDYRLRVLTPENQQEIVQKVPTIVQKVKSQPSVEGADDFSPMPSTSKSSTAAPGLALSASVGQTPERVINRKYSEKLVNTALCLVVKGDEAIMLIHSTKKRLLRYSAKKNSFPNGVKMGEWYTLEYRLMSTSDQHISVANVSTPSTTDLLPTRRIGDKICIRAAVWRSKERLLCTYGVVTETPQTEGISITAKDIVFAWVYPSNKSIYSIEQIESSGSTTQASSTQSKISTGIVCAMHDNVYFIYSAEHAFEVVFISAQSIEATSIFVGDWVEFETKNPSLDFLPDNKRATSLKVLKKEPLKSLACYDSVFVETEVDVPSNYASGRNPISSKFARSIRDDHELITECFHGTTLLAVLVYAFKPDEPCGFWRIETIRRVLRRY